MNGDDFGCINGNRAEQIGRDGRGIARNGERETERERGRG